MAYNNPYDSPFGAVGALRNTQNIIKSIGDEYIKRKQEERLANREMSALNMERAKAETNSAIEQLQAQRAKQESIDRNAMERDRLTQNQNQFEAGQTLNREKMAQDERLTNKDLALRYPANIRFMDYAKGIINDRKNSVDLRNSLSHMIEGVLQRGDEAELYALNVPMTPDDALRSLTVMSKNDPYKNAVETATQMYDSTVKRYGENIDLLNRLKTTTVVPLAKQIYNELSQNPFVKLEVTRYTEVPLSGGMTGMQNAERVSDDELRNLMSGKTPAQTQPGQLRTFAPGAIGAPPPQKTRGGFETVKYAYNIIPNTAYTSQFGNQPDVDEWITNKANQTRESVRNAVVGGIPQSLSNFTDEDYSILTKQIFDQLSENKESIDIGDLNKINQFISNPDNIKKIVGGYKPVNPTRNNSNTGNMGFNW